MSAGDELVDYKDSGLTIQYAMLDHFKRYPRKEDRPPHILWDGRKIVVADRINVPQRGQVMAEFITSKPGMRQGIDISLDGYLELANGDRVKLLRTWADARYGSTVQYQFFSNDGVMGVWNVYEMVWPGGRVTEEKWTGNAGFWIEPISDSQRTYHCSPGSANPPDFEALVFRISIS
jgi:hypothetical protein